MSNKLSVEQFNYHLPSELIAQAPLDARTDSRLLVLTRQTGALSHTCFSQLMTYCRAGDVLVVNNTKVIKARFFGQKATGGKVEILIERILSDNQQALAHIRASKSPKVGSIIHLSEEIAATVIAREDALFTLALTTSQWPAVCAELGHVPLPPYITRTSDAADANRYQTVFAKHHGSVAAPTAGLHFDDTMLEALRQLGVEIVPITLHVGAGTFQPVRVDNITDHHMHKEYYDISDKTAAVINAAKATRRRVIAVGTTAVRALESAAKDRCLSPAHTQTNLFIYPGFDFQIIDAMVTNFHLPKSSLLMLVSAFAGTEAIKYAYEAAIEEQYRFFSYGDAMLII